MKNRWGWIYAITNLITGKMYIGQTIQNLDIRFAQHKYAAKRGAKTVLARALRKYGEENFIIEPIWHGVVKQLDYMEMYFIAEWNTTTDGAGYNLTLGGDGVRPTKAVRAKLSKSKKEYAATPKGMAQTAAFLIRVADPEVMARSLASRIKTMATPAHRLKKSKALLKYYAGSPAAHEKTSKAASKRYEREEERIKASELALEWHRRPGSREIRVIAMNKPEAKARMSAAITAVWADKEKRARIVAAMNTEESHIKHVDSAKARFTREGESEKCSKAGKAYWATLSIEERAAATDARIGGLERDWHGRLIKRAA